MFSVKRKRSTRSNPWSCLFSYGIKYYATKLRIILEVANFSACFYNVGDNSLRNEVKWGRFCGRCGCEKPCSRPSFFLPRLIDETKGLCRPQCGEGFFASRAYYARIHCFSIFAFTSSPLCCNGLNCRVISVKVSPRKAFTDGVG